MSYIELLLLAVGLCFDTFAVSLTGGICINTRLKWYQNIKIIFFFAMAQAGFTFIGWLLGYSVSEYIKMFDHWVAFLLLLYIGGKMIFEALSRDKPEDGKSQMNLLDTKNLALLSVATSIDALAVGISLAVTGVAIIKIIVGLIMIFAVTALASEVGLSGGRRFGAKFGKRSELVGGIILILIGVKILIEHLVI